MARLCAIVVATSFAWILARADDTETLVQRVAEIQRHDKLTPEDAPICTDKEYDDWVALVKIAIEEDARQQKELKHNESLHAAQVLMEHLRPLVNATMESNHLVQEALKPAVQKLVVFGLQKLMKRKVPNTSLVDFNATLDELSESLVGIVDPVRELLMEGLRTVDEGLNTSYDALPMSMKAVTKRRPLPEQLDNTTLQAYMTEKLLPILITEMFPQLQEPLVLWANTPNWQPAFDTYMVNEVLPYITTKVTKMIHHVTLPDRSCVTCKERYDFMVSDMGSPESCMASCAPLVPMCKDGVSTTCLKLFAPCLQCQSQKLTELDKCRGTNETSAAVQKIDLIKNVLSGGTLKVDGVDSFLNRLSESLVE